VSDDPPFAESALRVAKGPGDTFGRARPPREGSREHLRLDAPQPEARVLADVEELPETEQGHPPRQVPLRIMSMITIR